MASGGTLNLSLLSRGVGEVQRNGHEKVEVYLEAEDYHNWINDPRRLYIPPLQRPMIDSYTGSNVLEELSIPKTYTTRKGALLLFSEDLAQKHNNARRRRNHGGQLSQSVDGIPLKTVDDLAKSILSYGSNEPDDNDVFLKFVHNKKRGIGERQMRPGFSAKRYLATWTKLWDDSVLEKIITKGYITERSLFHYNTILPHLKHRLNDDLSQFPAPYRLMRSMLMSPGSLSGYTFYKQHPTAAEITILEEDEGLPTHPADVVDQPLMVSRPPTTDSICIVRTRDGLQTEVTYASLDRQGKEEVLTDLLVKSAIHHALVKQQELIEENNDGNRLSTDTTQSEYRRNSASSVRSQIPMFDMKQAVESLLDVNKSSSLGSGLPKIANASYTSSYGGSFKGKTIPQHSARAFGGYYDFSGNWVPAQEEASEYSVTSSVVSARDSVSASSLSSARSMPWMSKQARSVDEAASVRTSASGPKVLPPIKATLTIIDKGESGLSLQPEGDVHLAGSDVPKVNIDPPTPQHSTLTSLPSRHGATSGGRILETTAEHVTDEEDMSSDAGRYHSSSMKKSIPSSHDDESQRSSQRSVLSLGIADAGPVVAGGSHLQESLESLYAPAGGSQTSGHTSNRSLRKGQSSSKSYTSSRKGAASLISDSSIKGSVIRAPDGEIVNVGGSLGSKYETGSVGDISQLQLDPSDHEGMLTDESGHLTSDDPSEAWNQGQLTPSGRVSDSMRMFANKRGAEYEKELSNLQDADLNYLYGSIVPDEDIDLTAGDIDATISMHGWSYLPPAPSSRRMSEQDLVNVLTERAQQIASAILGETGAGRDLNADVRRAADLWMEIHPPRKIDRSQSVNEQTDITLVNEVRHAQSKSAGPTVGEYRELLRQTLTTVVAQTPGMEGTSIPRDADISPELIQALVDQSLSPDDIEVVEDEVTGKSTIRSKSQLAHALGGVKEGHIYVPVDSEGNPLVDGAKGQMSIPRSGMRTEAKIGDLDVINYQGPEGGRSVPASVAGDGSQSSPDGSAKHRKSGKSTKSAVSFKDDESTESLTEAEILQQALEASLQLSGSPTKSDTSKSSKGKKKSKKEFIVGNVDRKSELKHLYGGQELPPIEDGTKGKPRDKKRPKSPVVGQAAEEKKGKTKKGKKKKHLEDTSMDQLGESQTLIGMTPTSAESRSREEDYDRASPTDSRREDDDMDFQFVPRSPTPSPEPTKSAMSLAPSASRTADTETEDALSDASAGDKGISNKDARKAKRFADAEKRRHDVDRKRREREEKIRRDREEADRNDKLKQELEEERRRREEERRLRRLQDEEDRNRQDAADLARILRDQREKEREERLKTEYTRKLEEMKRKKEEDDRLHQEMLLQRELEEEENRKQEEEMLSQMAEQDRLAYEQQKLEEAEQRQRDEEEARRKREEEAKKAMEEAERLAQEMARKKAELEARLQFTRSIEIEGHGLEHTQDITRAFIFSYFEFLKWLGIDISEADIAKMYQY